MLRYGRATACAANECYASWGTGAAVKWRGPNRLLSLLPGFGGK